MFQEVINKIKQNKNQENSHFGCEIIARELIKKDRNLGIQWVSKCIQSYLFEFKPSNYIELNNYVQQALDSQKVLTGSQYKEIGLKIWYMMGRDNAQTAVSRLWWAIAEFKLGEDDHGMRDLGASVDLLLFDRDRFDFERFDRYMTEAVKIYQQYELEK
ncbi:MAG: hypothetical protein QNJ38_12850 [Prochloraceae cyanobacterium]|nr:hypothetical protein [Prochloraceae cyanobacterium]